MEEKGENISQLPENENERLQIRVASTASQYEKYPLDALISIARTECKKLIEKNAELLNVLNLTRQLSQEQRSTYMARYYKVNAKISDMMEYYDSEFKDVDRIQVISHLVTTRELIRTISIFVRELRTFGHKEQTPQEATVHQFQTKRQDHKEENDNDTKE
jgi:hypothetical protein